MSTPWPEQRVRWWEGWARFFPEDATSLGAEGHADRLRDGAVGDEERAFHLASLAEMAWPPTLDPVEQLELEAIQRASAFRAHVLDHYDHDRRCLELSLYPHAMIAHHFAHARDASDVSDADARLGTLPSVLARRERALTEGLARGHVPDRGIAEVVVGYALPGAARGYGALAAALGERGLTPDDSFAANAQRAAKATLAHRAFVERELLPCSEVGAARLGEQELTTRLLHTYGEALAPRAIRDEARESIALLSARLVLSAAHAARARDLHVRDLREAHAYVALLFREQLPQATDPREHFAALIARATAFASESHLFSAPARAPEFVPIPEGMIHGGAITNWPAPLLDRSRNGHVALALTAASHAPAFAPGLAIHEATPGHYLQSAAWQALAARLPSAVPFVAVHDEVAMASSFFGAMPTIEGFAVHAEEVMFDAGFFDRDAEVASLASAVIRAARAAVDISLHLGEATPSEATEELHTYSGMPRAWCETQIVRFLRIPVQATTYFVGTRRLRAMFDQARVRQGPGFRADAFHDALLALGPASLTTLARRLRSQ